MAENLIQKGTEDTPEIEFDRGTSLFKISGRSYPENAREFYEPVLSWLADYGKSPSPSTSLEVDLEYVNSGSVKEVFKILYLIEDIVATGNQAKILWCYKKGDELMYQKGLEFQKFLEVPVELIER